jgi:glycosyltransferase involved in cell wall biosynthesis
MNFSSSASPFVSIVTVVLNDVNNIEATIKSVISQVDCTFEYIVIDGKSSDGTLDVISRYRENIKYFSSAKDKGIYFAMNKAIDVAQGEWLIFMNSGDVFTSPKVLASIFANGITGIDVLYGQSDVCYGGGQIRRRSVGKLDDLWKGMIFSHQSMLARVEVLKKNNFNCRFKLAADYELVARLLIGGFRFLYSPVVVSIVLSGGESDANRSIVFKEYLRISSFYFSDKNQRLFFALKSIDGFLRMLLKKCLPVSLIRWIQISKNFNKKCN